jgi:hypothetical protein
MCQEIQFRYRLCHCTWLPTTFPCEGEFKINRNCEHYEFVFRNIVSGDGYCAKHGQEKIESQKVIVESESTQIKEEDWFEPYILRSATLVGRGT